MGKFYIYNAKTNDSNFKEVTVIFNPSSELDINSLKNEINEHFANYYQTSAILFLHCILNKNFKTLIEKDSEKIFKGIPKIEEASLVKNIFYASYNEKGFSLNNIERSIKINFESIVNQGLINIFISNGGLVESNGISHHFVFPSGKHSAKFLRTANVLVKKSEINFIGINSLHKFHNINIQNIYCDTLSINVVAYAINQYLQRFNSNQLDINVESFKSYDGLYNKNTRFLSDSIFLISASTSGGIIQYLKESHGHLVNSNNVCVLFYLPIDKDNNLAKERVLCDLKKNDNLNTGIIKFDQFRPPSEKCIFCENKSTPIKILGDSFSLDEPIINTRNIIASKYISKNIKSFVEQFKYCDTHGTALKISFGESTIQRKKYDLYIDYEKVISNIGYYEKHKSKLDSYINQFVPAAVKYIIHLNDRGSKLLAEYIKNQIKDFTNNDIVIVNQSDLSENLINIETVGAILIVGSCITNGKNLLYLSRFFRNYEKLRLVYFIAINRISDESKQKELRSNIKYGFYGTENSSLIEIETINCDNSNQETPWEKELEFLKGIRENLNVSNTLIQKRISIIESFEDINVKGGDNYIFYPNLQNQELEIRKNSAFFNDNNYHKNVCQSDVYFSISCVLNNMRNNKKDGLFQTNFVKNLIDPFIFNRFNDGIIQSAILRAAKEDELNYSFSRKVSEDMFILLETILLYRNEYQGEAILEFLFALSIGKLRLYKTHYQEILDQVKLIDDDGIKMFIEPIENIYKKSL
ncbi:hypothetical protein [Chryseobacterium sp.]|uniref:hypothetical protein n=1 Tax=Chryseobacterium sp. TaxID=1871047 RepID=UPI00289E0FDD|nr:hypothetical protein [Chryseobacterium sp.]